MEQYIEVNVDPDGVNGDTWVSGNYVGDEVRVIVTVGPERTVTYDSQLIGHVQGGAHALTATINDGQPLPFADLVARHEADHRRGAFAHDEDDLYLYVEED